MRGSEQRELQPEEEAMRFRRALGAFPTGVTIVTSRLESGEPIGMTVNSFASVSLDPRLVLWSIAKTAGCYVPFALAKYWAVHILTSRQKELALQFARQGSPKFQGVDTVNGVGQVPLIEGCSSRFECETFNTYDGGDHLILVGRVIDFCSSEADSLVFCEGKFSKMEGLTSSSNSTADAPTARATQ